MLCVWIWAGFVWWLKLWVMFYSSFIKLLIDLLAAASSGADAADKTNADRAALFAEINAGEEITKRLKKVTPDMQTHKNPALRTQVRAQRFELADCPLHHMKPIFFFNFWFGNIQDVFIVLIFVMQDWYALPLQHEPVPAATGKTGKAAAGGSAKTPSVSKQEDKPPKTWLENGKQWNVVSSHVFRTFNLISLNSIHDSEKEAQLNLVPLLNQSGSFFYICISLYLSLYLSSWFT